MRSRLIEGATPQRTFVVVLDPEDEVVTQLRAAADHHDLAAAHFGGLGALSRAKLGYWRPDTKEYAPIEIAEQSEILSLVGNIAWSGNERRIHAHVTLGASDGKAYGGHLLEGYVNPTLEVMITELPEHLRRTVDAATGLPLLDFSGPPPLAPG